MVGLAGPLDVGASDLGRLPAVTGLDRLDHSQVLGARLVLAQLAEIVGRRVRWHYRQVAPARGHESWAEHAELVAAIEAGDEDQAAALARTHTERTRTAYHGEVMAGGPR